MLRDHAPYASQSLPLPCRIAPASFIALFYFLYSSHCYLPHSSWRHWGCVTAKLITNMKEIFGEADELDGFDDLKEADQEKLRKAWEEGHVDDADIPDSARKPAGEEEEEEDDEGGSGTKKSKGKKADAGGSNKFKLEYAASARAKCKSKSHRLCYRSPRNLGRC